ncbi:BrnT family toxin [candidate division KSB1 bacterium]|nr:BrnT family toxin [candidate division KSB1 bacterium]
MQYNFEWDPIKAHQNKIKHKINFETAAEVFLDPFALSIFDDMHSHDEDMWITIGKTKGDKLVILVHTFVVVDEMNVSVRIISARNPTKAEVVQYERK